MTRKFFEIVLSDLINKRDIAELEMTLVYDKNISLNEKIVVVENLLKIISEINNQIVTLTGMVTEEVTKTPHKEENNNK